MGTLCPPAKCGCFYGPFSFSRNTCVLLSTQAGEKHYHPLCALCVRCGRMFAEGEEMYLQGKDKIAPPSPLGQDRNSPGPLLCARWEQVGGLCQLTRWEVPPPSPVAACGRQSHELMMARTWRGTQDCLAPP